MPFGYRFIRESDYDKLVAERDSLVEQTRVATAAAAADGARAEFYRIHSNALEQDAARLRAAASGIPHTATTVEPRPPAGAMGRGIGIPGMDAGMFEDIDDLARRYTEGESPETLMPVTNGVQHSANDGVN